VKIAVDRSLGRLARWLRILGEDAAWEPDLADADLISLAGRGRMVVTRTRRVAEKLAPDRVVFITAPDPAGQLAQAARALGLSLDPERFFSRCARCNAPVVSLPREEALGRVPDYVYETQPAFTRCPACEKIFWPGTHRTRALDFFQTILSSRAARAGGKEAKPDHS